MRVGSLLLALKQVQLCTNRETLALGLALRLVESFSAHLPGFEAERVKELHGGPRFRIDASHDPDETVPIFALRYSAIVVATC
jgi:hypothetical protein